MWVWMALAHPPAGPPICASAAAQHDSPLYVFDGTFGDRANSKSLLEDYTVPKVRCRRRGAAALAVSQSVC